MQSSFISVHPIRDVYTAEKRQDHLLSLIRFFLSGLWLSSSFFNTVWSCVQNLCHHITFTGSHVNSVHTAINFWVSDHQGLESKCCVALFAFPFTPLSCPRRGFCCCISAFLLCVQEVRKQTSEGFDPCCPSPETNMRTEH